MARKKSKTWLWITLLIVFFIGVSVASIFVFKAVRQEGEFNPSELVARPLFGYYTCEESDIDQIIIGDILKDGMFLKCPATTFSKCEVTVSGEKLKGLTTSRRLVYKYCESSSESSCGTERIQNFGTNPGIFKIPDSLYVDQNYRYIKIKWQRKTIFVWEDHQDSPSATYKIAYRPAAIFVSSACSGADREISNTVACAIPSSDPNFINQLKSSTVPEFNSKANFKTQLNKREISNFVCDFVLAPPTNVETYNGREAYCVATEGQAKMYALDKIDTRAGTFKIVNLNYNAIIGDVTCCNGERRGNELCQDHRWIRLGGGEEVTCSLTRPCPGSGDFLNDPNNDKKAVKYGCESGSCQIVESKNVECTKDSQCLSNEVCQRFVCTATATAQEGSGQTRETTEQDCESKGGQFIQKESCGLFCKIGLREPNKTSYCKSMTQILLPYIFGLVAFLILVLVIFLATRRRR